MKLKKMTAKKQMLGRKVFYVLCILLEWLALLLSTYVLYGVLYGIIESNHLVQLTIIVVDISCIASSMALTSVIKGKREEKLNDEDKDESTK